MATGVLLGGNDGAPPGSDLKEQILQLARLACHENEEKSRTELLEKLKTCNKCTLVEFCRSFDIIGSTANKKHELVATVMEFLMEYCSVTDGTTKKFKRRRRTREGANFPGDKPLKKKKPELPDQTTLETLGEEEADRRKGEEDRTNCLVFDTKIYECTDDKKGQCPKEEPNTEPSERANGFMSGKLDGVALTGVPIPINEETLATTPSAILVRNVEGDNTNVKASGKKNTSITKKKTTAKMGIKDKSRGKQFSRGDAKPQKHAMRPSKDELRQAVFVILDTADFATMTFGDIIKQVDKYFGKDLFERKPLIRSLIEEELFRLAEEAEKKELEEEEAANAKARDENAVMNRAKDGSVESNIDKTNELQAGQDGKSIHAARNENGNYFEKGVKGGISVKAAQNRNRDAAVGSSQNGRGEDVNKKNSLSEFTIDGNSEKVMQDQDADGDANIEATKDGKAETEKENGNGDTLEGPEHGKTEGINDTKNEDAEDGRTEECRSGNAGDNAEDVIDSEAEEPNTNENGEYVEREENGKTDEIGNNDNCQNSVFPATKCGKAKEGMETINTEQACVTDAAADSNAEDAECNANTEADENSMKDGTPGNGMVDNDAETNCDARF